MITGNGDDGGRGKPRGHERMDELEMNGAGQAAVRREVHELTDLLRSDPNWEDLRTTLKDP